MLKKKAVISFVALALASLAAAMPVTSAAARGGALSDLRQRQNQITAQDNVSPGGGRAAVEALVEPGTPGAAMARTAADCSARFKTYDVATGTYIGRGGSVQRCP